MAGTGQHAPPVRGSVPELAFAVLGAARLEQAAAPALRFDLRIDAPGGEEIRSVLLDTQIQIAARRRAYEPASHERLADLFGQQSQWGTTLRTLLWTRTTVVVPPFTGSTTVGLPVACSYDLDVAASRYLDALDDGDVPLEFLFSGTVFYAGEGGALQAGRISWEQEAEFRLPVATWREALDRFFPGTAWLRIRKESYDRLRGYTARHALPTVDDAIDRLLAGEE
jgi:Family of unknown function (DUF6084)